MPVTKMSFHQTKYTAYSIGNDNIGLESTESGSPYLQDFISSNTPKSKHQLGCYTQDEAFDRAQPLVKDMSASIQTDPDLGFTHASSTSSRSPKIISNSQDPVVNTTKTINASECSTLEGVTLDNAYLTVQGLEKTVDRMVQEIYQGKYRFYYVYHPNRQGKGLCENGYSYMCMYTSLFMLCIVYNFTSIGCLQC